MGGGHDRHLSFLRRAVPPRSEAVDYSDAARLRLARTRTARVARRIALSARDSPARRKSSSGRDTSRGTCFTLMDLPNYFIADLPREHVMTPTLVTEACQTL